MEARSGPVGLFLVISDKTQGQCSNRCCYIFTRAQFYAIHVFISNLKGELDIFASSNLVLAYCGGLHIALQPWIQKLVYEEYVDAGQPLRMKDST